MYTWEPIIFIILQDILRSSDFWQILENQYLVMQREGRPYIMICQYSPQ